MAVNNTKDKVSDNLSSYYSSQINNDLYNVHAKPNVNKTSSTDLPKDSLESAKIKKEALERLTSSFMSDKTHAVLMRMAKYMFIAVAWPPYALLFELPKWVFLQIAPLLKQFSSSVANQIKKQFESLSSVFLPLLSFLQKTALQLAMPVIRLTTTVKELFKKVGLKTRSAFENTVAGLKKIVSLKTYTQALSNLADSVREKARALGRGLREPFEKLAKLDFKHLISQIMPTEMMQKIPQLPALFLGWAAQLALVQQSIFKFAQAQNLAEQGTNKFINILSSTIVAPLAFLVRSLQIAMKRVNSMLKSYLRKGYDFLGGKAKDMGEWIASKTKVLFQAETWKKLFPPFLFSWIPRFIREAFLRFFRWLFALPLTQSIVGGISNGWQEVIALPGKIKHGIVEKVSEAVGHARSAKESVKEKLASGARKFGWFCNRLVYWTLTGVIMTGIIADWGVQLLGRISSKVFRKMSRE